MYLSYLILNVELWSTICTSLKNYQDWYQNRIIIQKILTCKREFSNLLKIIGLWNSLKVV